MKALVFEGKEKLALRSLAKPVIQADEVLLRIKSVGLCGTDLHIYHGGMKVPQDAVLGHEFSGVIEEMGKNVSHLRVGDPVVAEHVVTCGKCSYCSRGKPNLCVVAEVIGVHRPGALAEYLALPASLVYPIPRSMSFDEAALIEPLSIALYAVREESFPLGKKVAVIGQGPIGLLIDQVLRLAGAFVVGIDVRDTTLQFAKEKNWVDHTINPEKESLAEAVKKLTEGGFDTVYDRDESRNCAQVGKHLLPRCFRVACKVRSHADCSQRIESARFLDLCLFFSRGDRPCRTEKSRPPKSHYTCLFDCRGKQSFC